MLPGLETTKTRKQKHPQPYDTGRNLDENTQKFKALGDETRLRILGLLSQGELCVCDIIEVLSLPQSTASRHLSYLKNSKWVTGNRRGKWMYYRIDNAISKDSTFGQILEHLGKLYQMQKDSKILAKYLKNKSKDTCS